jgi:hypothetical protein
MQTTEVRSFEVPRLAADFIPHKRKVKYVMRQFGCWNPCVAGARAERAERRARCIHRVRLNVGLKISYSLPQARLFYQFCRLAMRNPDAASLLLFRPINLLKRDFEWKNSDIAKHRPLLLNPSLSESANMLCANHAAYTGFFVSLYSRSLLRCAGLNRPTLTDHRRFFRVVINRIVSLR